MRLLRFLLFIILVQIPILQFSEIPLVNDILLPDIFHWWTRIQKLLDDLLMVATKSSQECAEDLDYLKKLSEGFSDKTLDSENVLLRMIDSSGRPRSGILNGALTWYGDPRECQNIQTKVPSRTREIEGTYCRVMFKLPGKDCPKDISDSMNSPLFSVDLCLPKGCSRSMDQIFNHSLAHNSTDLNFPIKLELCSVKCMEEKTRLQAPGFIVLCILMTILVITLIGTIIDYKRRNYHSKFGNETGNSFLDICMCFSLYSNMKEVLSTEKRSGQIECFNGIRFFSILWVLVGHTFFVVAMFSDDVLNAINYKTKWWMLPVLNGFFAVDNFFFISGFLTGYIFFKQVLKNPKIGFSPRTWFFYYLHRILRLSPAYYMVIAFYAFVIPEMLRTSVTAFHYDRLDSCSYNWWLNFLYVNNIFRYDDQCYISSWYLATDFQIFAVAPLFLIAISWKKKFGFLLCGLTIIASMLANFLTVFAFRFPALDFDSPFLPVDPEMVAPFSLYTLLIYDAAWIRIPAYIIGLLFGYLLVNWPSIKISKKVSISGYVLTACTAGLLIFSVRDYFQGNLPSVTSRAIYSAISKPLWVLCLGWMVTTCHYQAAGILNDFLSWKLWIPLGRVSYSIYLLHMTVITIFISVLPTRPVFGSIQAVFFESILPISAITILLAFPFCAIFEVGTAKVEAKIFANKPKKITPVVIYKEKF